MIIECISATVPDKKPDGRTYAAGKPKQVIKQQSAKRSRCRRRKMKAEEDMKEAQKELKKVDAQLNVKKEFLDMMSKAPTPAEQRKALLAMFAERGINPIEQLLEYTQDPEIKKPDKIALWKELASYTQPKLKSVDVQATVQGEMKILTVDYSKVMKDDIIDVSGGEYDEFLSDQDKNERTNTSSGVAT
tara:strand:- start:493 stop:1059 length:567 start_codon:yes stop_codon:yes gene_type:complete